MAYRFTPHEPLGDEIARVLREEIDQAIAEVTDRAKPEKQRIHGARLHCKRIRAVLRLVRLHDPTFFERENRSFGEASRSLAPWRDAEVMLTCFHGLLVHHAEEKSQSAFDGIRQLLLKHQRRHLSDRQVILGQLREFAARLRRARGRLSKWTASGADFTVVALTLRQTYRAGRRALDRAYATGRSDAFHLWRKHVKRHDYHCRLIRAAFPAVLRPWQEELSTLARLLGDEHDLAQLRGFLHSRGRARKDKAFHEVINFIDTRCDELRLEAEPLGRRLFAEKPKHLVQRLARWWRIAHEIPEAASGPAENRSP